GCVLVHPAASCFKSPEGQSTPILVNSTLIDKNIEPKKNMLTLQRTLIASTSLLYMSLGAPAHEAEGTTGTITPLQNNSAYVSSSVDFDVKVNFSNDGTFVLDGQNVAGRRSVDEVDTHSSTGNILSTIEFTEDNASIREFSTNV